MKNYFKIFLAIILIVIVSMILFIKNTTTTEDTDIDDFNFDKPKFLGSNQTHVSLLCENEGYNIYYPRAYGTSYRYGPSIIYYEDGTIDFYLASNANNVEWDYITYIHYDGEVFSDEKIILKPTKDSLDNYSVCDPAVIYFNDYYYLAYTSTTDATGGGLNNNIYVARSKNPDGPFEKWDGEGWSDDPKPIIKYDDEPGTWGAGEPSFVIKDKKLYIYYSWICTHGSYTKLATSDLSENWPANIKNEATVLKKDRAQDSLDVLYLDEIDKFMAVTIENRMSDLSAIEVLESDDGLNFKHSDTIRTNVSMYAHNIGISKKKDGHANSNDDLLLAYAYGPDWGRWAAKFHSIDLYIYDGKLKSLDSGGYNKYREMVYVNIDSHSALIGISTDDSYVNLDLNSSRTLSFFGYDQAIRRVPIDDSQITYDGYDENIIEITNNRVTALNTGITYVNAYYDNFYTRFKVVVNENNDIATFENINNDLIINLYDDGFYHQKIIHSLITFNNKTSLEISSDLSNYDINYEVLDSSICEVNNEGYIIPKKAGKTMITVSLNDLYFYEVEVSINRIKNNLND